MKNIQFDTGLNGGLSGACPSKDIARRLEAQTRDVLAQKDEAQRKYDALKNGDLQNMWQAGLKEIEIQEKIIKAEELKLRQEKEVADALGLGFFKNIGKSLCKKSIKRRERAENSLAEAKQLLGNIKGRYDDKFLQLKEGDIENKKIKLKNKATIAQLKKEIQAVKTKIANYKIERDNIKRAEAQAQAQAQTQAQAKVNSAGILSKKNLPIIAGALFLGGVLYFSKNGKKTTTIKRKKVTKKVSA